MTVIGEEKSWTNVEQDCMVTTERDVLDALTSES